MVATQEKLISATKSNVEDVLMIAKTAFTSAERLAALNLNTARKLMDSTAANIHAAMEVKNPQELFAFYRGMAMPAIDFAVAYSSSVYEIAAEAKAVLGSFFEERSGEIQGQVESVLERAMKNAPVGSDMALSAFKTAMASANTTFETVKKTSKQAVEMAESNVKAATAATLKSLKAAA